MENTEADRVNDLARLIDTAINKMPSASLNQIALKAHVDAGYLSRIRRGKISHPPSPDILRQLSRALHISYKELLRAAGYWDDSLEEQVQDPHQQMFFRAQRVLDEDDMAEIISIIDFKLQRAERRGLPKK